MERESAWWMKREDERILEFLDKEGLAGPDLVATEIFRKVSPGHVRERLYMLQYAGLVAKTGYKSYELTKDGERYLVGDLDATFQPTPKPKQVLHL